MSNSFKDLTSNEIEKFLQYLKENDVDHSFDKTCKFLKKPVSFLDGVMQVDVEDYSESPFVRKSFLMKAGLIRPLLFTNQPKEDFLFDFKLNLNDETAIDYLRFYCELWVQNGEQLKPVFTIEDMCWQDEISPMMRQSLDKDFKNYPQLSVIREGFMITFLCMFQQSLMAITFDVLQNGFVKIKDRVVLIDDLPIKNLP